MIVGICGSPRQQATEYVLAEALRILEEKGFKTKLWTVRGKEIGFCTHCDYCLVEKQCVIQDDMQDLYVLLTEAKGIILATPVYNGGVSAQIKALMDRTRAAVASDKNIFKGKIGMGIAVGGDRAGGQELALTQIHTFFILNGMIPVSGGYFGSNL
jgi:multimeric flavodoxin WrbA